MKETKHPGSKNCNSKTDPFWARVKEAFHHLSTLEPSQRNVYLRELKAKDSSLHDEVVSLLEVPSREVGQYDRGLTGIPDLLGDLHAGTTLGSYRVVKEIGRGGMGAVYLAERSDQSFRKSVAIKVLKKGFDSVELVRRFQNERQILATLDHPHIAKLLGGGTTEDGRPYFVMEYIRGESIVSYCNQANLSLQERIALFQKVCDAVHFAHQNLVVHRDLKPGNILVTPEGQPKLLDFGIAKILQREGEQPPTLAGGAGPPMTPEYASPEQLQGGNITTATDSYALGVLFYELLTGCKPYLWKNHNVEEIRALLAKGPPKKPSRVVFEMHQAEAGNQSGGVSGDRQKALSPFLRTRKFYRQMRGDLDNIALKALQAEPARRYSTAAQFSDDLTRYQRGFPVLARGDSFVYQLVKFVKRHRVPMGIAGTLMVSTIVFLVTLALEKEKTQRQKVKAEQAKLHAERERDGARRISDFLVEIFHYSDPFETGGTSVTARVLLDEAAERFRNELHHDPQVRAGLLRAMGQVYANIGDVEGAQKLWEMALDLRQSTSQAGVRDWVVTLAHLAWVEARNGNFREAERYYQQALDPMLAVFPIPHDQVSPLLLSWARFKVDQGRYEDALDLVQVVILPLDDRIPEHQEHLAKAWMLKGTVLVHLGRLEQVESLFCNALEVLEARFGSDHLNLAETLIEMAELYRGKGAFEKAEGLLNRALRIQTHNLGEDHPHLAESNIRMGNFFFEKGNYAKAEAHFLSGIALIERNYGADHVSLGEIFGNLGMVYLRMGNYPQAESSMRRSVEIHGNNLDEDHPELAVAVNNLGLLHSKIGQYEEAEALFLRALAVKEKVFGPQHSKVANTLNNLAMLYKNRGDYRQATGVFERVLTINTNQYGAHHSRVAVTRINLAATYGLLGMNPQALQHFQQAISIQEEAHGPNHPYLGIFFNNFGHFYNQNHNFSEAEPLLRRSLEIKTKAFGPETASVAATLTNLGECLLGQKKLELAETELKRALEIQKQVLPSGHPKTCTTLTVLGRLYLAKNRIPEAEAAIGEAMTLGQQAWGERHVLLSTPLHFRGVLRRIQGRVDAATKDLQRALVLRRDTLGEKHLMVGETCHELAICHWQAGRARAAREMAGAAYHIFHNQLGPGHPLTQTVKTTRETVASLPTKP